MENEYYTVSDIEIITGYDEEDVLYIIKKYGIDAYKRIYMKEEALDKYLYEGFEKDAIQSLLLECNILK